MPTRRLYTCFTYHKLDVEAMRTAAGYLVGEHDFKSFCQAGAQVDSTVRRIHSIELLEQGHELVLRVCGGGFLYNMVRIIAGTLMEVGQGRRRPEDMEAVLAACNRRAAGPTAPAQGLTLVKYEFEDNISDAAFFGKKCKNHIDSGKTYNIINHCGGVCTPCYLWF